MTMSREEWLATLEQERFNVAHRVVTPAKTIVLEVPKPCSREHRQACKKTHATDERDQIFYHAGRYAQGARDTNAVKAQEQLDHLLEETK